MKKMKKLVALILAGVMVMALLTACGGGGGGSKSFEAQVEDAVFAAYSQALGRNNLKTNDPALKKLAQKSIGYVKNGRFSYADMEKCIEVSASADNPDEATLSYAMPVPDPNGYESEYSYKVLAVTPEMLGNLKENMKNVDDELEDVVVDVEEHGGKIDAIGVAAKTIDGKTYVALAMAITGNEELFDSLF